MIKPLDYERYIFRLIKQENGEIFDSFVRRLHMQAKKCYYADFESQMKDQIIEKCGRNDLRKEALSNQMTLKQLTFTGRTLELAEMNCERSKTQKFNRDLSDETSGRSDDPSNIANNHCTRCGFPNHFHNDPKCPALKGSCGLCKKPRHFSRMCRERRRPANPLLPDSAVKRQKTSAVVVPKNLPQSFVGSQLSTVSAIEIKKQSLPITTPASTTSIEAQNPNILSSLDLLPESVENFRKPLDTDLIKSTKPRSLQTPIKVPEREQNVFNNAMSSTPTTSMNAAATSSTQQNMPQKTPQQSPLTSASSNFNSLMTTSAKPAPSNQVPQRFVIILKFQ